MNDQLPLVVKLPDEYSVEIGRIMVRWAHIEWRLHQIGYRLLDIDPATGRLVMREPKEPQYIDMIEDLMSIYEFSIPPGVPLLRTGLEKWGKWRNLVAHGVWVQHPETEEYMAQLTTGQWDRSKLAPGERLSRQILTEAVTITPTFLREMVRALDTIGQQLEAFWRQVDKAMPPSLPDKSQPQSRIRDRRVDYIARKLSSRQQSSSPKPRFLWARILFGQIRTRVRSLLGLRR